MQENIVAQGLELMLYGMGTVVVFLALLVLATSGMSRAINRYFPEPVAEPARSREQPAAGPGEAELVAVITAAVRRHRRQRPQRNP